MTESIVRDTEHDGHWFVFIDGFQAGELITTEDLEGWPVSYHFTLVSNLFLSDGYATLAEAECALVQAHKAQLSS